ncbi:hypothetical protein Stsp02_68950 [Streptomyces sp. NBRC 14336]|nr:hypothetical protein Stsp02_68950 [Streptomyces sp. NBRC 14336]
MASLRADMVPPVPGHSYVCRTRNIIRERRGHSGPDRQIGGYRNARTAKFGEKVVLPEPMGIELDTEVLKNYVR